MATDPAVAMARLTAARTAQLVDTCTVHRPADLGQTPELDANGDVADPGGDPIYDDLPCVFSDPRTALLGGRTSSDESGTPNQRALKVPHTASLRPGDVVTAKTCPFSPGLVGDRFVVQGEDERSYATYRRYILRGSSWLAG